MTEPKIDVTVTRKTTFTITEESAAAILRKAVGAPDSAIVEFDCGYDILREITIEWTEEE